MQMQDCSCNLCCGYLPLQLGSNLIGYWSVYQLIKNWLSYDLEFTMYLLPLDFICVSAFVYELYR